MNVAAARKDEPQLFGAQQESAHVVSVAPLTVRAGDVTYAARRAVGCLVDPRVGDEALVALLPDGRAYVLTVLEREGGAALVIGVEGDCTVKASGRMSVVGAGMNLMSTEDLAILAGRFSVRAVASSLASETLQIVSRTLTGELERVKVAAKSFDGFFDRVTQRAKQSLRVSESDLVRADRIDHTAKQTLRMHAANSVVTADQVVKIDAGQVQLG